MQQLNGKKLLIVSSDSNDIAFVNAAKELGAYTICCDRYSDWNKSPAKKHADEAWDLDYTNLDEVLKKCKESGVDGVIAGYSEDRVMAACRISNALGTNFYATEEQINITRNKAVFKELCEKYGVPVPKNYDDNAEAMTDIKYPVIVKPADSGGRKGISVCFSDEELKVAVEEAKENSKHGDVVIEEYVVGLELSSVYTISDGDISLSCLNDKYNSEYEDGFSRLCDLVITPSKYYDLYVETVDQGIRDLLNAIGVKNGVANFQMIAGEDGIKVFEMGYRVNGNDDFKVISKNNGIDFCKMLVSYSLTGEMGDDLSKDNPCFDSYNCTVCVYLHGGTVDRIVSKGLEGKEGIDDITILCEPGREIIENGTSGQKVAMVKLSAKSLDEAIDLIHYIQDNLLFFDKDNNNMALPLFNTDRLFG